jgi:hypothetical protein
MKEIRNLKNNFDEVKLKMAHDQEFNQMRVDRDKYIREAERLDKLCNSMKDSNSKLKFQL